MEIPQREIATSAAGRLVRSNPQRVSADTSSPKKEIALSATPIFGIRWGAQVIRRVAADRLREIIRPIRNSNLGNANYQRGRALWTAAHINGPNFPSSWGDWRALIGKSNLDSAKPLKDWVEAIGNLTKMGRAEPLKIAQISSEVLMDSPPDGLDKLTAMRLWEAASFSATDTPSASIFMLNGVSGDAEKIIKNRADLFYAREQSHLI